MNQREWDAGYLRAALNLPRINARGPSWQAGYAAGVRGRGAAAQSRAASIAHREIIDRAEAARVAEGRADA